MQTNKLEATLTNKRKTATKRTNKKTAIQPFEANEPKGTMTRLYWCDDEELGLMFRLFSETRTNLAAEELWGRYERRFMAQARSWTGGNPEMANDALGELKTRLFTKAVQQGFNPLGRGNGWQPWASTILYHEVLQLFRRLKTIRWELTKRHLGSSSHWGSLKTSSTS